MLTATTLLGIKVLIYLHLHGDDRPVPPRRIAEQLEASPTYLGKVTSLLVKASLLRSFRGAQGGVRLVRPLSEITLLEVVEACQGRLLEDFCQPVVDETHVCAFHVAMRELHESMVHVLSKWTMAELAERPGPTADLGGETTCRLGLCPPGDRQALPRRRADIS